MVDGHGEHDGLREEDAQRAQHAVAELGAEGPVVLVGHAVVRGGRGEALVVRFARGEDDGGVGLLEEEEADEGVEGAHDREDPEDPSPAEGLHDQPPKEGTQGRAKEGAKEVPAEDAGALARVEHVANGAAAVGDADTWIY